MVICVCQNITERDIATAVASGCSSFAALQEKLEVSTCCGTCECMARETFEQHEAAVARTSAVAA